MFCFYKHGFRLFHKGWTLFLFIFCFLLTPSPLRSKQPEDKLTDTLIVPVNSVNKTLVQTCEMRMLSLESRALLIH